jgi:hypothetical protein
MSLCRTDVELLERWAALGGVPQDRSTRDFICDHLLLRLWEDRQAWVQIADDLQDIERDRQGPTASPLPVALGAPGPASHADSPTAHRTRGGLPELPTPLAAQGTTHDRPMAAGQPSKATGDHR